MVLRSLPKKLVKRVRTLAKRKAPSELTRLVLRLKNADHRNLDLTELSKVSNQSELDIPGGRVRQANVGRNFPKINEIIIKRAHGRFVGSGNAKEIVNYLKKAVLEHNRIHGDKDYYLLKPIAYHVGKDFVLMAKANKFSAEQILLATTSEKLDSYTHVNVASPQKYILELAVELRMPVRELRNQLRTSLLLLDERMQLGKGNYLVAGYKNKKFIFVPLIDLF